MGKTLEVIGVILAGIKRDLTKAKQDPKKDASSLGLWPPVAPKSVLEHAVAEVKVRVDDARDDDDVIFVERQLLVVPSSVLCFRDHDVFVDLWVERGWEDKHLELRGMPLELVGSLLHNGLWDEHQIRLRFNLCDSVL